mgnify:CR=1 FL=1
MMHPAFDPMDIAGLHLWQREESGDNSLQHQRLLQNLTKAVEAELTPRQKEMLYLYYYEKLNMARPPPFASHPAIQPLKIENTS